MADIRHYCFVYRMIGELKLDRRLPIGGVSVAGPAWPHTFREEMEIISAAYDLAKKRFPCRPGEYLAAYEVKDSVRKRQAQLMERDWMRAYREFEELMMV
jgi:hypothetical protein